jgi:hypothetical protein
MRMMYRLQVSKLRKVARPSSKEVYVLNLSLGKAVLLRGILGQLVNCWTRCSNSQIYIISPSQNSQPNFRSCYLFWLGRQCCPVKSGSAAHNRPLDSGGYLYPSGPAHNGHLPHWVTLLKNRQNQSSSLSSIVAPPSLKQILESSHQNLREKAAKLDWRVDPLIPKV